MKMKVFDLLELAKLRSEKKEENLEIAFLNEVFERAYDLAYSSNRDDVRALLQELSACLIDRIEDRNSSVITNLQEYHEELFED